MNGIETTGIITIVNVVGFGTLLWKIGKRDGAWQEKLDELRHGQHEIKASMVTQALCDATGKEVNGHFSSIEDRVGELEHIKVLPREIDAMQKGYQAAISTLTGDINRRFGALETGQEQMRGEINGLSKEVARLANGGGRR